MLRRIIILSLLLAFLTPVLFSNDKADRSFTDISMLLKEDKKLSDETVYEIQSLSVDLSGSQKLVMMREYEKDAVIPVVLNVFLPFGIGSFYQGDIAGGVGYVVSEVLINTSYLAYTYIYLPARMQTITNKQNEYYYGTPEYDKYQSQMSNLATEALIVTGAYVVGYLGIKIFSYVRPFTFASSYNKRLEDALNPGFSMAPVITPTLTSNGDTGLFAGLTVRL